MEPPLTQPPLTRDLRYLSNLITTCLDVLGLLAVAGGVGAWSVGRLDGRGLALAGAVLLVGSWWFARQADPARVRVSARLAAGRRWVVARWPHPVKAYRLRELERAYQATAAKAGVS